jgi:hypothetical protein
MICSRDKTAAQPAAFRLLIYALFVGSQPLLVVFNRKFSRYVTEQFNEWYYVWM